MLREEDSKMFLLTIVLLTLWRVSLLIENNSTLLVFMLPHQKIEGALFYLLSGMLFQISLTLLYTIGFIKIFSLEKDLPSH